MITPAPRAGVALIVPTLCVGTQPGTLRVPSEAERGATSAASSTRERSCN